MRRRPATWALGVGLLALLLCGCGSGARTAPKPPAAANSALGVLDTALAAAKSGDEAMLLSCLAAPVATEDHPLRQLLAQRSLRGITWHLATVKAADASQVAALAVEFSAPVTVGSESYRHLFAWAMVDTAANRTAQLGAAQLRPNVPGPTGRWTVSTSKLDNFDASTSNVYFSGRPQAPSPAVVDKVLNGG